MAISDTAIKAAKPKAKPYKLSDDEGLFLLIAPSGSKLWRLKYRFSGQEKLLSFGAYPTIGLKEARQRRDEAKAMVAQQVCLSVHRWTGARPMSENTINLALRRLGYSGDEMTAQVMQHAALDYLLFPLPVIIEYLSGFTTLNPGDVILTGTPGGVGLLKNTIVEEETISHFYG